MGERRISDEELIDEIRRLASNLQKTPSAEMMREQGAYSYETYRIRFGGWNEALDRAELPKNRNIPEDELVDELREFAAKIGRAPTQDEMDDDGPYSVWVYKDRFGSWSEAKQVAGLSSPIRPSDRVDDNEVLEEIQRVRAELGHPPSAAEMDEHGEISSSTAGKRFGNWENSLRMAGLDSSAENQPIPSLVLLIEIRSLAEVIGRTPTVADLYEHGNFSEVPYVRAFGSYSKALQEAGLQPNHRPSPEATVVTECTECGETLERYKSVISETEHVFCSRECFHSFKSRFYSGPNHWAWSPDTGYGPNWEETRQDVLERDDYRCQQCGVTEREHLERTGQSLHIHHIRPRAEFDDLEKADVLENLVALCRHCHLQIETERRGQ